MTERRRIAERQGVDMTPAAVAARLHTVADLTRLMLSLRTARPLGRARDRRPSWQRRKSEASGA